MDYENFSDGKLISAYLNDDAKAFEILYTRYKRPLYSYLNKLLPGQTQLADDVFQQAWVKAIRNFKNYKENNNFLAWMIRIARNLSIDYFRKEEKRKTTPIENREIESLDISVFSKLVNEELKIEIDDALQQLPQDQREVFVLRQDEISFKDIADIQETSLNTALGRMHYAIQKLRTILRKRL